MTFSSSTAKLPLSLGEAGDSAILRPKEWPKPGGFFHTFSGEAVDLQGELESRMAALDRPSYEGVLRPAFQQDEWKLILAGAVLGATAGILQLVYIFGDAMERLSR